MRKMLIAILMVLLSYFLFTQLALAAKCCCYTCNGACATNCDIYTGTACPDTDVCYSTSKSECEQSNCGSTTKCGKTECPNGVDKTFYCCYTGSGYSWQSSSCSQSCPTTSTTSTSTTTTTSTTTSSTTTTSTTTTLPSCPYTCMDETTCYDMYGGECKYDYYCSSGCCCKTGETTSTTTSTTTTTRPTTSTSTTTTTTTTTSSTTTTTTTTIPSHVCCQPAAQPYPYCEEGTSCPSGTQQVSCSSCSDCSNCIKPYPNVTYEWKNVKTSSADVYIKVDTQGATYNGKITFVIRKNVKYGYDECCYLDGTCSSSSSSQCPSEYKYTAFDPVGSGTKEYIKTFTAKEEGDYHFDVWYEDHHYGATSNVHLKPACDSSSYTSCGSAFNFGSSSGSKSNMCGNEQYYTVSAPTGKKCNITWKVSSSDSDYDLYVKWSADCPSTSSYDCSSTNSGTSDESCSKDGVMSSYALVKKVSGSGTYTISVSVENCVDAECEACGNPTCNDWFCTCWRKMKDQNCKDLDWYDFSSSVSGFPKCGIGASWAQHYDAIGRGWWCPETEAMWKSIKCGGGWPSGGNEGDTCKVWFLTLSGAKWRQGKWDPDDGYCIITDGDPPTGGCTADRRESTVDGVIDTCGGRKAGDGKCEQACGADAACDEKDPGEYCGTLGRCTSYCSCCEASDSDNGINFTVKGTTNGTVLEEGSYSCQSKTDYCVNSTTVREYYINYLRLLVYSDYDCSKDGKKCVDGQCVCCQTDADCPAVNNTKGKCNSPYGTDNPNTPGYTYTCYWLKCNLDSDCVSGTYCYCGACSSSFTSSGCASNQCCNRGYGGSGIGSCVPAGTIYSNYLCVS